MKHPRFVVSALSLALCAGTTLAQQVKISQVYGGGGNATAPFNRDFVEIFNAGAAPVDISGWSVQYAAATGTTWSKTDLTGAILQPGQYYLVQMTLTGTTGAALPTPDHTAATAISMAATAGKVALVSNTTALSGACPTGLQIIDFVGFGTTANCNEGGANTGAPGNPTAVLRNNNGCDDSGNNGADFTVGAPNPRNTGSPVNPCPLPPGADLGVSISDGIGQISLGASTTYNVGVSNFGPDLSPNATVTFTIPAGAAFISSVPAGVPVGDSVTFTTGPVGLGGTASISVTLRADSGTALAPSVSVAGVLADSVSSNNTASDSDVIYDRGRVRAVIGAGAATAPVTAFDAASGGTEALFTDEVRALAADDSDRMLYYSKGTSLWRASYDLPRTPELVASFNGAVTTISGGMAFDVSRRKLIASTTSSFYEVNRKTGRTTLLRAVGAGDFAGIDYDAANDRVAATNDSTSTTNGLSGRGLYRIDVYSTESPVLVAGYPVKTAPSTLDTDIDGLAYGGGRWYAAADENNWFYTYDEGSGSYQANLSTGFGADRTNSGAAYTEQLFTRPAGANLSVTTTSATADCSISTGGDITYRVAVRNLGPASATGVQIASTIPFGSTFVSSNPPATVIGDSVSYSAGTLADGESATLEITVAALSSGVLSFSGSATSGTADAFASNNADSTTVRVAPLPPATAEAKGVFSTLPGSNAVPGLPGVSFSDAVDMGRPYRSADGSRWVMHADTDIADALQDRVLLRGTSSGFDVVAQEGVTLLAVGFPTTATFDAVVGVNNNGDFCFSSDYVTLTTSGKVVAKFVGGSPAGVAEQSAAAGPIVGALYGGTMGSTSIQNDGTVSFYSTLTGVPATEDSALFKADGTVVAAQQGLTIPGGQLGAAAWENFSFSTDRGFYVSADGMHYAAGGDLTGLTTTDSVAVVDDNVVIQEGAILPNSPFGSTVSSILMTYMNPDGAWFAYGSNADGSDWAVRNGQLLAKRGDEVFTGSGIHWAEAGFAQTFFMAVGNARGDYVVGGLTDSPEPLANAMLVLNGTRIVLREGDPIDLNNNGVFDDDAYVHIFRDDFAFLTDSGDLYVPVRLRNGTCTDAPTESGQALVRISVGAPACPRDFNGDGFVDPDDLSDYITCFFTAPPCSRADLNGDGVVDPDDLSDYISLFFGPPC